MIFIMNDFCHEFLQSSVSTKPEVEQLNNNIVYVGTTTEESKDVNNRIIGSVTVTVTKVTMQLLVTYESRSHVESCILGIDNWHIAQRYVKPVPKN